MKTIRTKMEKGGYIT